MQLCCWFLLLQEPSSIEKVAEIDEHIGCAMSGLTADAKTLIDHARADTQVGGWACLGWACYANQHLQLLLQAVWALFVSGACMVGSLTCPMQLLT